MSKRKISIQWALPLLAIFSVAIGCFLPGTSLADKRPLAGSQHKRASDSSGTDALFNQGVAYYQKGQFKDAIPPLRRVVEINPQDETALVLLGIIYLQIESFDQAEKYLKSALDLNPQNFDAAHNLSIVYYHQKRYEAAIDQLLQCLSLQPNSVDALLNLGVIYTEINRLDDAIQTYKRIVPLDPDAERAYTSLAKLYFQKNLYDEVIRMYAHASAKMAQSSETLTNIAFAYFYKDDLKMALKYFMRSKQVNPSKPETYYGLGLIAERSGDVDGALAAFKQALQLNPNYLNAMQEISQTYEDKGDYIKALYFSHQVLKSAPDDEAAKNRYLGVKAKAIDYYLRKGSQGYLDGEYQDALLSWDKVLKLDPQNSNAIKFMQTARAKMENEIKAHNDAAENFYAQNRYSDAYQEWDLVLKIDPESKAAQAGLKKLKLKKTEKTDIDTAQALHYIKRGNTKMALEQFKTTLQSDPNNLIAKQYVEKIQTEQRSDSEKYYRKGIELYSQGQLREAIANLEQAQEVDPKDQRTKNLLYKARTQLRDNVKALLARGVELANAGRISEAKERFNEVLKQNPGDAEATAYLGKLTGQVTHMAVNKDEIKKLYYDGVSLYLDGQNRRAIDVWRKILVLDPENQEAKSSIAKAEMELKEMEKRGIKVE